MTSAESSFAFILNPVSSGGKSLNFWKSFEKNLKNENISYQLFQTTKSGEAVELVQKAIQSGFKKIIAIGGDGTLHQVANGILSQSFYDTKDIAMGLIPMGTGNDFGRYWKLPVKNSLIISMMKNHKIVLQDVIKVNYIRENKNIFLISMGGCGFDSSVALKAHNEKLKGRGGKLVYLRCLLQSLFGYKSTTMKIVVDEKKYVGKFFSVAIGNNHSNGGGIMQCPGASMTDGKLNITMLGDLTLGEILWNLKGMFNGSFTKHKKVTTSFGQKIFLECSEENILELDGEPYYNLPVSLEIVPSMLSVIIPK